MNIYVDLTNQQFSNSRGVPLLRPFKFTAGSVPQLRIHFLRNGAVVAPTLASLSVSLGRLGAATAAATTSYTVETPSNAHLVQLDLSTSTVTDALSYSAWATATSVTSKRAYLFGSEEDLTSLVTAKGFRVLVTYSGSTYAIPSGLFSVDAVARIVTIDSSVTLASGSTIAVEAVIPKGVFYLRVKSAEIFSSTTSSSTTNTSNTVTVPSTTGIFVGATVSGTGIPDGTTVVTIVNATSFTISASATATGNPTLTVQRARTIAVSAPAHVSALIA